MRKMVWMLAAATALPASAMAQQGPTRSVDEYVCTFSDDCAEAPATAPTADETVTAKGKARVSSTRGFKLTRPKIGAAEPAAAPARRAPTATASRQRAKAAPKSAARSERRRADLRLSFDLGSATLTPQAREEAKIFAAALRTPQLSGKRFVIEGHTDSIGGRAYNLDLSRRRAEAVVEYLGSLGVDRSRLEVRGYGFDRPLDGRTAHAVENRRVEAVLAS